MTGPAHLSPALEAPMHILGLPWQSFLVLIAIPLAIVGYQYFVCWQIRTGRRE